MDTRFNKKKEEIRKKIRDNEKLLEFFSFFLFLLNLLTINFIILNSSI
jgi:hypothetical protein